MHGIISGGYNCRRHGTLYTYEGTWEQTGSAVRWRAKVFYDKRLGEESGELVVAANSDPGVAVRDAIHAYIEDVSCAAAVRSANSCGRRIDPLAI